MFVGHISVFFGEMSIEVFCPFFLMFGAIFFFYWSRVGLHCCVSFCCTVKGITYTYTYIPISLLSYVSLPPSLSHLSSWTQSPELISCAMWLLPTSYFTFGSVYLSMPLSHFVPASPSPFLCPQVHSLCLHLVLIKMSRFCILS